MTKPLEVWCRKIKADGETRSTWHILSSPSGEYPAMGYLPQDTGCTTKAELLEELEIRHDRNIRIIST